MGKRLFAIMLLLALVGVIGQIARTSIKTYQSTKYVQLLEAEVDSIKSENKDLRRALQERVDPFYVESVARNKLNYSFANEKLVVIVDDFQEEVEVEGEAQVLARKKPWEQWKLLLLPIQ